MNKTVIELLEEKIKIVFLGLNACHGMNDLRCRTLEARQGSVRVEVQFGHIFSSFQNQLVLLKLRGKEDPSPYNSTK